MESCREIHSDISPVPRFDLIAIDHFTILVALSPSIAMSILCKPGIVFRILRIREELIGSRCLEYVDRETELVLTPTGESTEIRTASSEIPETLLILGTAIGRDNCELNREMLIKVIRESPECIIGISTEHAPSASFIDRGSCDRYESDRDIVRIVQREARRDESEYTHVIEVIRIENHFSQKRKWFL
jgi:hypothetical protein